MSKKTLGLVLTIVGVVVAMISLLADSIGIGTYPGINSAQLIGFIIGSIILIIGLWLFFTKTKSLS